MYMRLGFSIAIHVKPEILLVDEILAVGDTEFQEKCFQKMREFKNNGVTIIFISHNLDQVKEFCQRTILINHSKLVCNDKTEKSCHQYFLICQKK